MKIYTVHVKPGTVSPYEKPVFVSEGFNVWAFIFTLFWAIYQRMWGMSLALVALNIAFVSMGKAHILSEDSLIIVQLAVNVIIGFCANDWQRAKLAKSGYIVADISAGDSLLRAEQRYFERYLAHAAQ